MTELKVLFTKKEIEELKKIPATLTVEYKQWGYDMSYENKESKEPKEYFMSAENYRELLTTIFHQSDNYAYLRSDRSKANFDKIYKIVYDKMDKYKLYPLR